MSDAERTALPGPLTIGILSDTHVNDRGSRRLPPEVGALFARFGAGLILHAGDLNSLSVIEDLERVAPVLAVRGNSDLPETRRTLPARREIEIAGRTIVLVHGDAGPTANRTAEAMAGKADCVIYGHSHMPRMELVRETLLFNPGSATDKRWWPDYSVGLLRVTEAGLEPELVVFQRPQDLDRVMP